MKRYSHRQMLKALGTVADRIEFLQHMTFDDSVRFWLSDAKAAMLLAIKAEEDAQ
ncbi:MAG TPA: hypothetical protein VMF32_25455 [Xanthobacteraceae bacterium]|nr:hypothetical protein [Xanthobacteraceae bacterium]